jgi:hypothetical protein
MASGGSGSPARVSHLDNLGTRMRRSPTAKAVARMRVVVGPGAGSVLDIFTGANTIGRGTTNDVQLSFGDATVAEHQHAVIEVRGAGDAFTLYDGIQLGPVLLNGVAVVGSKGFAIGDVVTVGSIGLRLEAL